MSIRLRLTLLYTTILALALIGFSLLSYLSVANDGLAVQTNTLAIKAHRIITSADFQLNEIDSVSALFAGPEVFVQTRDAQAVVVDRTQNLAANTLPIERANLVAGDPQSAWSEIADVNGERLLIFNQPIGEQDKIDGVLQIASSLTEREQSLTRFRNLLVLSTALINVMAFVIGWALAGLGLRPIQRITEAAHMIGTQRDFSRRVEQSTSKDEVAQLAATFNSMLAGLQDAHQQTEDALNAQRRFVADASHELRTPLTTIRGNIHLLQRTPPISEADRQSVMEDISNESDRLIRLVSNLLILARRDTGQMLQCEWFPLRPIIEEVHRQAHLLAPDRSIHMEVPPEANVQAHRDTLKQVLLILIDNACKHTPAQVAITFTVRVDFDSVTLQVADNGPGIDPQSLPHLFDRFYQVEPERNQAGSGLGLAIAKALIEAQGGHIGVKSVRGRGSIFSVVLPCAFQKD